MVNLRHTAGTHLARSSAARKKEDPRPDKGAWQDKLNYRGAPKLGWQEKARLSELRSTGRKIVEESRH